MARLTALPSINIIRGFKHTLDFYLWKGLPCVRSWPHTPPHRRTPATIAAAALFGSILTSYRLVAPTVLEAYQQNAKGIPRTPRDVYVSGVLGHLHERTEPPPPPPPEEEMYDAYVCLRDLKPQGTAAGAFNFDAWRTRDLTEQQADTADICALAANEFTLPAGSYRCLIRCPANRVDLHQTRLYDVTAAAVLLVGASAYARVGSYDQSNSVIAGRFTLAATHTLQVQHHCQTSRASDGFGKPCDFTDEIYTTAEFWRERPED